MQVPHAIVSGLYVTGEPRSIHQRGSFHSLTQLPAQLRQARQIAGKRKRGIDEAAVAVERQVAELKLEQLTRAATPDTGLSDT